MPDEPRDVVLEVLELLCHEQSMPVPRCNQSALGLCR